MSKPANEAGVSSVASIVGILGYLKVIRCGTSRLDCLLQAAETANPLDGGRCYVLPVGCGIRILGLSGDRMGFVITMAADAQ